MVTLRYLREQEEAAVRRARLEEVRRIGSALGVQRARSYAVQKKQQAARVRDDMRRQWACEVQQQAALIDRVMYDSQAKFGEGMRAAADMIAGQREHAERELNAWAADHALQQERHRIARAAACVAQALKEEPQRSVAERKEAVRLAEDRHSKTVIARSPPTKPNFVAKSSPLAGAISLKKIGQRSERPTTAVTVMVTTPSATALGAGDCGGTVSATQFREERERAMASAKEAVERGQREAAERAAVYLSQRKEEEQRASEAARRRAVSRAAFERCVSAGPPNNDLSTQGDTNFFEVRRAAMLKAREEAEFEQLFLRASLPQSSDEIAVATEEKDIITGYGLDSGTCFFPPSSIVSLLPADTDPAVKLLPMPFSVQPYNDEVSAAYDDNDNDKDNNDYCAFVDATSEVEGDKSSVVSGEQHPALPMKLQESLELSRRTLRASEEMQPVVNAATPQPAVSLDGPPAALSPSSTPPKSARAVVGVASTSCKLQNLPLRHEHFLSNLKALQEKLASAAVNVSCNDSSDVSLCHGTISISSMSSFQTPAQASRKDEAGEEGDKNGGREHNASLMDASGGSDSSFPSSMRSSSYPTMTADQLKAALLSLRLRMKSA